MGFDISYADARDAHAQEGDEYCIPSGFCHLPLSVKVLLGPPLIPAGIIIGVWVLIRERQYSEAATLRCVLAVFGGGLISTLGFALVIN